MMDRALVIGATAITLLAGLAVAGALALFYEGSTAPTLEDELRGEEAW